MKLVYEYFFSFLSVCSPACVDLVISDCFVVGRMGKPREQKKKDENEEKVPEIIPSSFTEEGPEDIQRLDAFLKSRRQRRVPMLGDGNCLFRGAAHCLLGNQVRDC